MESQPESAAGRVKVYYAHEKEVSILRVEIKQTYSQTTDFEIALEICNTRMGINN